jgi:hypothetical protein
MKWVGQIELKNVTEEEEAFKACKMLRAMGATKIQFRLSEKSNGYGYTNILTVCGYKE